MTAIEWSRQAPLNFSCGGTEGEKKLFGAGFGQHMHGKCRLIRWPPNFGVGGNSCLLSLGFKVRSTSRRRMLELGLEVCGCLDTSTDSSILSNTLVFIKREKNGSILCDLDTSVWTSHLNWFWVLVKLKCKIQIDQGNYPFETWFMPFCHYHGW